MSIFQVKMASTPKVQSIVLPHDGGLPYTLDFLLVTPGTSDISIDDCKGDEELLGLIPKIWVQHEQTFSWDRRSVTLIYAQDIEGHGGDWRESYLFYSCRDKDAGLPPNNYLKRISDELVYGDAYFFKLRMERRLEDGGVAPTYLDLNLEFVFALDGAMMSLSGILRALLDRMAEEEGEEGLNVIAPAA